MTCTFCGKSTDFLAHAPNLCLDCGDAIQTPEGLKDFVTLHKHYKDSAIRMSKALDKIDSALKGFPLNNVTEVIKVALDEARAK